MTHHQLSKLSRYTVLGLAALQLTFVLATASFTHAQSSGPINNTGEGGNNCLIIDDVPLCSPSPIPSLSPSPSPQQQTSNTNNNNNTNNTGGTTNTGGSNNTTTTVTTPSPTKTASTATTTKTTPSPTATSTKPSPSPSPIKSTVSTIQTASPSPSSEAMSNATVTTPGSTPSPLVSATPNPTNREDHVAQQLISDYAIQEPLVLAAAGTVIPVVLVVAGPTAALLTLNSLQAIANLPNFILNAWTHLMVLLGIKRRREPWGKVINSVTSEPIVGATVTLSSVDTDGQLKVIDRITTDNEGRYGFLTAAGNYVLQAQKIGYTFPTKVTRGVYGGHAFRIDNQKTVTLDLYCDPAESTLSLGAYVRRFIGLLERFRFVFLIIGTVLVAYSLSVQANLFNLVLVVLYIALWLNEFLHYDSSRRTIKITDTSGRAIPFALFRLYNEKSKTAILTKITDTFGEAYLLVPSGKYKIQIPSPRNPQGTTQSINLPQGIVPRHMAIKVDY